MWFRKIRFKPETFNSLKYIKVLNILIDQLGTRLVKAEESYKPPQHLNSEIALQKE